MKPYGGKIIFLIAFVSSALAAGCSDSTYIVNPKSDVEEGEFEAADNEESEETADEAVIAETEKDAAETTEDEREGETGEKDEAEEETILCAGALPLQCGDKLNHDTTINGRPNQWSGYSCTARAESGPETLYVLTTQSDCRAIIRLNNLKDDIDLFRLSECDSWRCSHASSTPQDIQKGETVAFNAKAGEGNIVVVDGYADDAGAYTIEVDCFCEGKTDDTYGCKSANDPECACFYRGGVCINESSQRCPMGFRKSFKSGICGQDEPTCCIPYKSTECEIGEGYCQDPEGICYDGYEHLPSLPQLGCEEFGANCCYPLNKRTCIAGGGQCNDYSDTCSMGYKKADYLKCDTGVCCVPMTCQETGGTCYDNACPQGWGKPRYGDEFTCATGQVCCVQTDVCPVFISSLAQCAFQYFNGELGYPACPDLMLCRDEPLCKFDSDCPLMDSAELGGYCVTGNCVYCWQDDQCPNEMLCRGGRCVNRGAVACPAPPVCDKPRCALTEISEVVCPVCVCDTIFDDACGDDNDCKPMAHHYFTRCVYGRCAECRNSDDCQGGQECLPPGLCYSMAEHPSKIYGTWLIGWRGALNHYSYFRFEPDGTLLRGSYEASGGWMDDIFLGYSYISPEVLSKPLIGTWEPEMTQSGQFIIRVDFKAWSSSSEQNIERFSVTVSQNEKYATLKSIDHSDAIELEGMRVDPSECEPNFSKCRTPEMF